MPTAEKGIFRAYPASNATNQGLVKAQHLPAWTARSIPLTAFANRECTRSRPSATRPRPNLFLPSFRNSGCRREMLILPHPRPGRTCAGCPSIGAVPGVSVQIPGKRKCAVRCPYPPVVVVPDLVHDVVVATIETLSMASPRCYIGSTSQRTSRRRRRTRTRHPAWCSSSGTGR